MAGGSPEPCTSSRAYCAKANSIEPHAYLAYVYQRLPLASRLEDYEALLPWNVELSESS